MSNMTLFLDFMNATDWISRHFLIVMIELHIQMSRKIKEIPDY
jgi:hypothetical protein